MHVGGCLTWCVTSLTSSACSGSPPQCSTFSSYIMALFHSTILRSALPLRSPTGAFLCSNWLSITLPWLYLNLLHSTASTMAPFHSAWLYITSPWLYFTLLYCTFLYHARLYFTLLYITLPCMALLHSIFLYSYYSTKAINFTLLDSELLYHGFPLLCHSSTWLH